MSWIVDNWFNLASGVLATLAGLYAVGLLVAPKTANKWDDKIVAGLGFVLSLGRRLLGKVRK